MTEALKIVEGERQADYGSPRVNHQRIADLWNAYLGDLFDAEGQRFQIQPETAAILMMLVKLARERHRPKEDNILDLVGYALVYQEILADDGKKKAKNRRSGRRR